MWRIERDLKLVNWKCSKRAEKQREERMEMYAEALENARKTNRPHEAQTYTRLLAEQKWGPKNGDMG